MWQERPSAIVMLTNCEEAGRVKCELYWPESGKKNYGPFQIIITDKQILADYTCSQERYDHSEFNTADMKDNRHKYNRVTTN